MPRVGLGGPNYRPLLPPSQVQTASINHCFARAAKGMPAAVHACLCAGLKFAVRARDFVLCMTPSRLPAGFFYTACQEAVGECWTWLAGVLLLLP